MVWAFVVGVVTVLMLVPTVLLLKRSEELGEGKIAGGVVGCSLAVFVIVVSIFGMFYTV